MATVTRKRGREITYEVQDNQLIVSRPLVYDVRDETAALLESDIVELPGLPKVNEIVTEPGSRYEVMCKRKHAVEDQSKKGYWTVTCYCDNQPGKAAVTLGTGGNESDTSDPTQWQVLVDLSFETAELVIETDVFGNPIQNFARRPYAEPVMQKKLIPVLAFTQYENSQQSLREISSRNGTVSSQVYLDGCKGGWHLSVEDSDIVYKNGVYCWRIDYKLRYFEKYVTNLANGGELLTVDDGGNIVDIGNTDLVFAVGSDKVVGGWNPIRPQLDYIDINGAPVVDAKENQILGKLDTLGVKASGATQGSALTYWLLHQTTPYKDFSSFLRIQGA